MDAPDSLHLIESGQRLSRSLLWNCQRRFFEQSGIDAWRRAIVPHFVTSNTYIARAYSQMVFAWLRDVVVGENPPNPEQPIYLLELGSGPGLFAFHFLSEFFGLLDGSSLCGLDVRYVISDFSPATLEHVRRHPRMQPWIEAGRLDFAHFDGERDDALVLLHSGKALSPGSVRNPLAVIANYFFDGLAADVFRAGNGQLEEGLLSLSSTQPEPDLAEPGIIGRSTCSFGYRPVAADYYPEPGFNELLLEYQGGPESRAFTFPVGALRCLERLRAIAPDRMLLLTADKGFHLPEDVGVHAAPFLTVHGSFSIAVNYHALGLYCQQQGGALLCTTHRAASLDVCAAIFDGGTGCAYAETWQSFRQSVELFGPDDFFSLCRSAMPKEGEASPAEIIRFLRFTGWDTRRALNCLPDLAKYAAGAGERGRRDLWAAVAQIWDRYYHLDETRDLPQALAVLCSQMDGYKEALEFLGHSLALRGPSAATLRLMAMCQYEVGDRAAALGSLRKWLEVEPDSDEAQTLEREVVAELTA